MTARATCDWPFGVTNDSLRKPFTAKRDMTQFPTKKRSRKHKVLVLLVGIGALITFRIVYLKLSTPLAFRNALEGRRVWEESNRKHGLVDYGNGTWGPPIIDRSETNADNTNMVNKSTNQ